VLLRPQLQPCYTYNESVLITVLTLLPILCSTTNNLFNNTSSELREVFSPPSFKIISNPLNQQY